MSDQHPLISLLLGRRNIPENEHEQFLSPAYTDRPDPFLMKDMSVAVARIAEVIEKGEAIAAWTDYDCDGIPAGALLADVFAALEYPLRSYIPDRSEGYGLNTEGIQKLKDEGISLIITADVGITNVAEVAYAQTQGIDVIVTDHHLPQEKLPPAVAVLNPHRTDCAYPYKELCGTGVAFKLTEALFTHLREKRDVPNACGIGQEKWLLDLVALATVADMVPLTGENRTLVQYGLLVLKKGRRKGLRALLERMRIPLTHVTEDDFSFSIAPKINAASRMASPLLGLELLTTNDEVRATELAKALIKLNDGRKLEGARVAKEVKRRVEGAPLESVVVLGHSSWKPALLGIAATNIVETYGRTTCLWGKEGDLIKGSCRSDGSVNIVSLLGHCNDVFEDFGGHEASGGFSLTQEAIHALPEILQKAYTAVASQEEKKESTVVADTTLSLSEVSVRTYRALRALAPFGVGNVKPVFEITNVRVEKMQWFGKSKEHVRLTLSDMQGTTRDAIGFFANRASFRHTLELLSDGDIVTVYAAVEQSFFAGRNELRLRLESITLKTER
ncbi:MAG: single-stranded-DNA-specific exonuclease RecJ [Patescibacteria group bacterium UBA2163]